jgi:peptide/nickel transport system permease protein
VSSLVLRRLLAALPVLWGVATAVFLLVEAAPGRPFHLEGGAGIDPAAAERLRAVFGTEEPLPRRYGRWLARAATGDLGRSYTHRRPVTEVIAASLGNTALLAGLALLLQFVAGTALGVAAAVSRRWLGRGLAGLASFLYAVPSFWIGLLLTGLLAVRLGWLPASQIRCLRRS